MQAAEPFARRRGLVRTVAITAVIGVLSTVVTVFNATPASADVPDPGIVQLRDTLAGASNSVETWTQQLATIGKLADALPGVPASAGSVLGFTDLLQKVFDDTKDGAEAISAATTDDDFDNLNHEFAIGDDRTGTVTGDIATDNLTGDKTLDITISATKTITDQKLSVPLPIGGNSSAPQSAFSSVGGVDLTVTGTLTFQLVWDSVSNKVLITANDATPRIDVDASASIDDMTAMKAAIGILGVSVVSPSTIDLAAHFASTISDPNNDGHLAFTELDGSAGELAQAGSLDGLVDMGFDTTAGHLTGSLHLNAAAGDSFGALALPDVNATIGISWPDISLGTPTVTPTGIDVVGKFLNMTPRDLADGLGQLSTALTAMQKADIGTATTPLGNVNLPFVKGTLADAIKLNEVLLEFLHDHTTSADTDAAAAGNPDFVSLQGMLDELTDATFDAVDGASLGVSDVSYDDATNKLAFTLSFGRDTTTAVDLNAAGAAASGGTGTTYDATHLFEAASHPDWTPDEFAGHHVVAGTSGATIVSNTADTLVLDSNGWTPTVPTAGAAYTISGMQGDVGAVQLGDALKSGSPAKGIGKANAVNATAKVTPTYAGQVTLVLDLQPPVPHDPPAQISNPDGSTYLAAFTPIGADRVLLRTSDTNLFHADFPIDATADINANAGFLQVELKGGVHICQTNAGADCSGTPGADDHMLSVDLKDNGDLTFGAVVDKLLHHPGDLLGFDVNVRAVGGVDITVPGTTDFFPGADPHADFHWNDITELDPTATDGPKFDVSDLTELANIDFDPSNSKALFSIILKTLQTLDKAIGDANPSSATIFDEKIPLVGRSLRDLLRSDESGAGPGVSYGANTLTDSSKSFPDSLKGRTVVAGTQIGVVTGVSGGTLTMASNWTTAPATGTPYLLRSELDDAISLLEASPSDNLQELVRQLDDRLAGTPLSFEYKELSGQPSLVINLDWQRSFKTSSPVQFDFDIPAGGYSVAGVQGTGSVSLDAGGHIQIGVVVPLVPGDGPADSSTLKILDDSSIGVSLDASVDDATLATTIGPLKLSLGDPTSSDKANAKASYSVDLGAPSPTGDAVSFDDFISGVDADLNASSHAVDCGAVPSDTDTTELSLCASLPLYISTDGGTSYSKLIDPGANAFTLRLPKVGADLADTFDLSGAQIDGHDRLETPDGTALGNAILSHLLDFTQVNGIDGYLQLIEAALNAASFGGKLPLIGDDLQQGADFVGTLRSTFDSAIAQLPANGDMGDTQGVRDWVNNELAAGLTSAGVNPDLVKVDTECNSALSSPDAPTVTSDQDDSEPWSYVVAAYQLDADGNKEWTTVGAEGSVSGASDLSAHPNHISWTAVPGADGYQVFRDTGGDVYLAIGDPQTGLTLDDSGQVATTPPDNTAGPNPTRRNCSYSDVDAIRIRLDVGKGTFDGSDVMTCPALGDPHECLHDSVPLDIGVPGLSLRGKDGGGPGYELGYRLHFEFGVSRDHGFFVDTDGLQNNATAPELALGLNFTLPSTISAELAFITITAGNCTNTTDGCGDDAPDAAAPLFGGTFQINMKSPHTDGLLTLADFSDASLDQLFDVKLTAGLNIDWLLKATVGDDAGFPGIQAELRMGWAWTSQDPSATLPTVSFTNVAIDAGAVFGQILGPIVNKIKQVTGPIDPIIKTLYAPIPVLSDLSHLVGGDDVTLVSIAKAFSTLADGPDLTFVDTIAGIVSFINDFPDCTVSCIIPIGSFDMDPGKVVNDTATPDNTDSLIKPGTKALDAGVSGAGGALGVLDTKAGQNALSGSGSQGAKAGFSFPVFEKPATLFNLLLGGDVDLVKFDSGPLSLGFDWRQSFGPVYAPPPVFITLHGSGSVSLRIVAGFDTYGIRKAFEKARNDDTFDITSVGDAILQSLFFYTTEDGKPIPVVSFNGEIAAGAEVSAVIIKVGIEGGLGLTVSFLWNDPNADGKFRISEFLQAALNNPICLFTVSGRLYVFLKAYVTIGFSPFDFTFDFTIVDVTLLDFSATPDCAPPPPELGGISDDGHTLVVYAASLDDPRGPDYTDQEKETIKVTSLHDYSDPDNPTFTGVAINMLGIRREYRNADIQRVIVDGHDYSGPMSVTFLGDGKNDSAKTGPPPPTAQFELDAIVLGGSNKDKIKTGIGSSWVDGGGDDDVIVTGDRTVLNSDATDYIRPDAAAFVAGGAGNDSITVGSGNDTVSGDDELDYDQTTISTKQLVNDDRDGGDPNGDDGQAPFGADGDDSVDVNVPDWTTFSGPTMDETSPSPQGNDTIKLGLGDSTAYGNGGNDTLSVPPDSKDLAKLHPDSAALFESPGSELRGGTGNDNIAGGNGDDTIYTAEDGGGFSLPPFFDIPSIVDDQDAPGGVDTGATNIVDTGTGNDVVYGSTGVDLVTGHSQFDEHLDIRGGAGQDVLTGGYGTDKVFGGPDDDYVIAEPSEVGEPGADDGFGPSRSVTHLDLPAGVTPNAKVLVGGTGDDHVIGGNGGASIDGDGYNETDRCAPGDPVASDPVDESVNLPADGNDKIIGGTGVENVRAGGGDDDVDVKANDDLACGESGGDTLRGGPNDDQAWGGSGVDTIYGDDGADQLYGNDEGDTIYGSNGTDTIEGNDGTDWITGGNQADVILGGTRAASRDDTGDFLFGDADVDDIIGDNGDIVGARWYPLDLDGVTATAGGEDWIWGGSSGDRLYGGLADDHIFGGGGADMIEGNDASDTIYGEADADDIIGGSSEIASDDDPFDLDAVGRPDAGDEIHGGDSDDVITGDNAVIVDVGIGLGHLATESRGMTTERSVRLLDLGYTPAAGTSGGDTINGDAGPDVVLGQGAVDTIAGDAGDDYLEGGQAGDTITGGTDSDDIVGGSSTIESGTVLAQTAAGQLDGSDTIAGNDQDDVVIGDNGIVHRVAPASPLTTSRSITPRHIDLYDLGDTPVANTSDGDDIEGGSQPDVILGQAGNDRIKGESGGDYAEGGPGQDWVEGNDNDDDLIGGSSTIRNGATGDASRGQPDAADVIWGGGGDDVVTGDNALVTRNNSNGFTWSELTNRVGSAMNIETRRSLQLLDLSNTPNGILTPPAATQFGGDQLSGGSGVDVMFGQDGQDRLSGGFDDDYAEGNGDADKSWGDISLSDAGVPALLPAPTWHGTASGEPALNGPASLHGQDDLLGGSSRQGFRDAGDEIHGNGAADFELGDNGTVRRVPTGDVNAMTNTKYVRRYATPTPATAADVRIPAAGQVSTRFCPTSGTLCEVGGASGPDSLFGDDGDDTMYGQDGNDLMWGGNADDDMYGELGDDQLWGEAGNDAMLGDRGGVVDQYEDGSHHTHLDYNQVPQIHYHVFPPGTVTRITDLQHDVQGTTFVNATGTPITNQLGSKMPKDGVAFGGNDRMRGGTGDDSMHGGVGDDLINGDSHGDAVFGDDGADVLWGGKGCDAQVDQATPDCLTNGVFDPNARGTEDRMVDYVLGGKGATTGPSVDPNSGDLGSDIIDWRPRGSYTTPGTTCTTNPWPLTTGPKKTAVTIDPCSWFEMTNLTDGNDADNQHHQGIDWQYGGWDRDILQGDVADNGPNSGDRLLDWTGAYNLYTHCNAAYGGYNDVRQFSPDMQDFLQRWTYELGGGFSVSDVQNSTTSAFNELALVYQPDIKTHGSGPDFPTTPGHFDDPNACAP